MAVLVAFVLFVLVFVLGMLRDMRERRGPMSARECVKFWAGSFALVAAVAVGFFSWFGVYQIVSRGPFQTVRINRLTGHAWVFHSEGNDGGYWSAVEEPELLFDTWEKRQKDKRR